MNLFPLSPHIGSICGHALITMSRIWEVARTPPWLASGSWLSGRARRAATRAAQERLALPRLTPRSSPRPSRGVRVTPQCHGAAN